MKKFITGFLSGALIFSVVGVMAATSYIAEPVKYKILVNGKEFTSNPPALVVEGRTYLPLRAMGDALGVPVEWNAELGQAEVGFAPSASDTTEYSRTNPAPLNTVQTYTKTSDYVEELNYSVNVRVVETIRGEAAWKKIVETNQFNNPAPEGYEYVLAKIAFSVLNTKGDFAVTAADFNFDAYSSNNEEMKAAGVVVPEPTLSGNVYTGGSTEGWITVMVKKDDPNPKLAYGLEYNGTGGIWFALN